MNSLSNFSAAVIGCGGLGCNAAVHLAGMGIGRLVLCDCDLVEKSNLNRQHLYTCADIGRPKAEQAAKRLGEYAPDTEIIVFNKKISTAEDLSFASDCDVVISAVDNNRARSVIFSFCEKKGIPMINGGISSFSGNAYCYVPGHTPCPDCAGITGTSENRGESISSTAGIIGALEAELAARLLFGDFSRAGILFVYDNSELTPLKIKQSADCKICNN